MEKLEEQREEINRLLDENIFNDESHEVELLKEFRSVQNEIIKYTSSLYVEISH